MCIYIFATYFGCLSHSVGVCVHNWRLYLLACTGCLYFCGFFLTLGCCVLFGLLLVVVCVKLFGCLFYLFCLRTDARFLLVVVFGFAC